MNLSRKTLDELRSVAQHLVEAKQRGDREPYTLEALRLAEADVDAIIVARTACPECPFCRGAVVNTPTEGRLGCIDCGAVLLRGPGIAVEHQA